MSKLSSIFPLLAILALSSCAGTPATPTWAGSTAAMRDAFPESEFIALQGRGATRATAEADGTAAIARFFNSEVTSRIAVLERGWEGAGGSGSRSETEAEIFVQSQMQLFAVRHATDAYFDKAGREWVTVAYINRAEAWQVHEPRFRQQAETFYRLFEVAENERDPFRKALRFTSAQDFARSPDFQGAVSMGQLLFPVRMGANFSQVSQYLAALPEMAADTRRNATVFIEIDSDFESIVYTAFSRKLASLGFPVSNNRNAAAVCTVTVEEGRQDRQLGIFYFPKVQATITSPAGTLSTFSAEGEQQSAVTPDVAKRRAYQSLATAVANDFSLQTGL